MAWLNLYKKKEVVYNGPGVTIRMEKKVSLSTVALLSLLWDKEKRDYLDVIAQFVLRCLPTKINAQIDIDEITEKLRGEFGFEDIPHHVVEKILVRLCHNQVNGKKYVYKSYRRFYTNDIYEGGAFDKDRLQINTCITEVLNALSDYLEKNYIHKKIGLDEAADFLFHFFETYGLTVVQDHRLLRSITSANGEHNFFVARFIIENFEKKTPLETRLIEITKGFLIYKAVYFYSAEMKTSIESKLKNSSFYFDCSLIIDALGYDSLSEECSFDEMCQLIRSNGGKTCVFEHTIEEAGNLLEAYANKAHKRNSFSFPELEKRNYTPEILFSLAQPSSITANLRKKNISVVSIPSYDPVKKPYGKEYYDGFQDEDSIKKQLQKYQTGIKSESGINYDVQTLAAIGRLRKNKQPTHIENCIAILVTQSSGVCRCMHDLYPEQFPPEIGFAIKDVDLVSILWLSQYSKESQLPKNILIANAVAACQLSQEIMDEAISLANRMEGDKTISPEAALIIRSSPLIRPILFEKTLNNTENMNETTIEETIKAFVAQESQEAQDTAIEKAVNEAVCTMKQSYENQIKIAEEKAKKALTHEREQAILMRNDAENEAKKKANVIKNITYYGLLCIWIVVLAGSIYSWWKAGFSRENIFLLIISILGLLQIADYIFKFLDLPHNLAKRVYDFVFTIEYERRIKEKEKISHTSLTI